MGGEEAQSWRTTILEMEVIALSYVEALGICKRTLHLRSVQYMSVAECASQSGRECLTAAEKVGRFDNVAVQNAASVCFAFTCVDSNKQRINAENLACWNRLTKKWRR